MNNIEILYGGRGSAKSGLRNDLYMSPKMFTVMRNALSKDFRRKHRREPIELRDGVGNVFWSECMFDRDVPPFVER